MAFKATKNAGGSVAREGKGKGKGKAGKLLLLLKSDGFSFEIC